MFTVYGPIGSRKKHYSLVWYICKRRIFRARTANQSARKAIFAGLVYTDPGYYVSEQPIRVRKKVLFLVWYMRQWIMRCVCVCVCVCMCVCLRGTLVCFSRYVLQASPAKPLYCIAPFVANNRHNSSHLFAHVSWVFHLSVTEATPNNYVTA